MLGAALYRNNDCDQAAGAFSNARQHRNETSRGFAGFLFALNVWQLNRKADARKHFHDAVQWMDENNRPDKELWRFRRETAELLGVNDSQPNRQDLPNI